ncbi:MAG: ABC transporter substrate-binding protein [Acidobacteriota bacterium]
MRPRLEWDISEGASGRHGGELVVGLRAEPRTFNPVLAADQASRTVLWRTMADLIRIHPLRQEPVAAVASRWEELPDRRGLRLHLRRGLRFSDGHPLNADDVLFSLQVYLDESVGSPQRALLVVEGKPVLRLQKVDQHTLDALWTMPYAVGVKLFDSLAVLPEHRLGEAYRQGRFLESWGTATPVEELVGLGPFRISRYLPGERLELEPNPHYWKLDRRDQRLPYLRRLTFLFTGSEEAGRLRFAAGELHLLDRISADSFTSLENRQQSAGQSPRPYRLQDLGPGLAYSFLLLNQNAPSPQLSPARRQELERSRRWFQQAKFRRALSLTVDREAIVRLAYDRRATPILGPVSPGNQHWFADDLPAPQRDVDTARKLLQESRFQWRDDGQLIDPQGHEVRFTVVTNSGNAVRARIASLLQQDLLELGIDLRTAIIDFAALGQRLFDSFDYQATILALTDGLDPNPGLNVWLSDGSHHLWRLHQESPATPWEAQLDSLLRQQMTEVRPEARREQYRKAQHIIAEQQPFIFLVSPNVLGGSHRDLGNVRPSIIDQGTLWNAEELYWIREQDSPSTPGVLSDSR